MRMITSTCGVVLTLALCGTAAAQSTHPRDYLAIQEETSTGRLVPIAVTGLKVEIDRRSDVLLTFDRTKLGAAVAALGGEGRIELRVEASITRAGATQTAPLAIDNYYALIKDKAGTVVDVTISDQALINNAGEVSGVIPDATLDLTSQALSSGDVVRVRVTNLSTQESVDKLLTAREFGLIGEVKDSFFFLKRLNVSDGDAADGIDRVNFGPAPGVSYLWTVSPRSAGAGKVIRPSFGINVSFADWNDPAFNTATGQFAPGTNASDIEITAGGVLGLFDGAIQFTAGGNLNADTKRGYVGVGFSFVNVVDRLGKLIAKK